MKQLLKVVEVLPKRQFDSKNGEKIEVVTLRLQQGRDKFVADALGGDEYRFRPQGKGEAWNLI